MSAHLVLLQNTSSAVLLFIVTIQHDVFHDTAALGSTHSNAVLRNVGHFALPAHTDRCAAQLLVVNLDGPTSYGDKTCQCVYKLGLTVSLYPADT